MEDQSRRKFMAAFATAAAATGMTFLPSVVKAGVKDVKDLKFDFKDNKRGISDMSKKLKQLGSMKHPVAYDISQANPWGFIWSNVYYLTNDDTSNSQLGVLNVLRHHGMIYALNDATIKKYKLGEFFGVNDPITNKPITKNPYYEPAEGAFPVPGLAGIKGLQNMGAQFCVCNMARQVYAGFVAQKFGVSQEKVYKDFVDGTLPGITSAPSGVWVLGRLAENKIAYIDASVG